jgi:hypothetical protein
MGSHARPEIWTFWKSPLGPLANHLLELGMQGGVLHKKYKVYLDHVGVAHVPENYEDRLTEIFPKVFKHPPPGP